MHTLLLVTLYLSLTNVASMRRIENRASCEKELSIRLSHSQSYLPVWMGRRRRRREKKKKFLTNSSMQPGDCIKSFTALQRLFCSSWCFCCKAEVIDITMGMLCCWARQAQSDVVLIYWFSWHFPTLHRLGQHVRKYLMLSVHAASLYKLDATLAASCCIGIGGLMSPQR